MLIESKNKIWHSSIFNICKANFKNAHLLHKMPKGFLFNPIIVDLDLRLQSIFLGLCIAKALGFLITIANFVCIDYSLNWNFHFLGAKYGSTYLHGIKYLGVFDYENDWIDTVIPNLAKCSITRPSQTGGYEESAGSCVLNYSEQMHLELAILHCTYVWIIFIDLVSGAVWIIGVWSGSFKRFALH